MARKKKVVDIQNYAPVTPVKLELNRNNLSDFKTVLLSLKENSIDEIQINYLIHYLIPDDRIWLTNRLYEILKSEGKATFTLPAWSSNRAYGDLLLQWPPVTESWFPHLNAQWRKENNSYDNRYTCDFDFTIGYGMHPLIVSRNQEYQQHAIMFWKEASQELIATIIKKG